MTRRIVVVGNGMVGARFCDQVRRRDPDGRRVKVTVLGAEARPAYNRVLLSTVLTGGLSAAAVTLLVRGKSGPGPTYRAQGFRTLDDGVLPADQLVVATEVRAETALAETAGLALDGGILVDDHLTTSDDRVHAIGDCARHPGAVAGVVQPGWEQAAVLADLLTGADPAARLPRHPYRHPAQGPDPHDRTVPHAPVPLTLGARP